MSDITATENPFGSNPPLLDGRVVLVSGVGPGLGRSLALAAARDGAAVALVARSEDRLNDIAAEVEAIGARALVVPTDITDEAACVAAVEATEAELGGLDALANNAFVQPPFVRLEDESLDAIRQGFEVNLFAHLSLSKAAAPAFRRRGGGSIVMTLSSTLRHAREHFGAYKMAKHGLLAMTRTLALELGSDQIRVNAIAPGFIYDDPVKWYFEILAEQEGRTAAEVEAEITARHPMGWIPTPDDICEVAIFLMSKRARAVTGQCIDVNGGEFMV